MNLRSHDNDYGWASGRLAGAMRVPREKLYEEVWTEPMTTVAKRYDVSSNFLARVLLLPFSLSRSPFLRS